MTASDRGPCQFIVFSAGVTPYPCGLSEDHEYHRPGGRHPYSPFPGVSTSTPTAEVEHQGHGEGLDRLIGTVPGCPACDAQTATVQGRAMGEFLDAVAEASGAEHDTTTSLVEYGRPGLTSVRCSYDDEDGNPLYRVPTITEAYDAGARAALATTAAPGENPYAGPAMLGSQRVAATNSTMRAARRDAWDEGFAAAGRATTADTDPPPPDPHLYVPGVEPDHATEGSLYHQRLLGQALGGVLVAAGGVEDSPMTGPQLLMFADDLRHHLVEHPLASGDRPAEPEREWYCEAEATGHPSSPCSPANPIHSNPCGWMDPGAAGVQPEPDAAQLEYQRDESEGGSVTVDGGHQPPSPQGDR